MLWANVVLDDDQIRLFRNRAYIIATNASVLRAINIDYLMLAVF